MKKIITLALSLVLACVLAVTADAAAIHIQPEPSRVDAGASVAVTITLEESIDAAQSATMFQGVLCYDGDLLEFVKAEPGEGYTRLTAAKHAAADEVRMHDLSMDNTALYFPAGTIATVYFTAREELEADHAEAAISFTAAIQNAAGADVGSLTVSDGVSVLVCGSHTWDAGTVTAAPTCTASGTMTYTCTYEGCDAQLQESYGEPLGHSYTDGICSRCGQEDLSVVTTGYCGDNLTWVLTSNGVMTFYGQGEMRKYFSPGTTSWNAYIDRITEVVLPEGLTSISNFAFYGMPNLKTIHLPEGLISIGEFAFKNCPSLDGVTLPDSLKKIGQSAFYGCSSLTAIDIPEGIYTIWSYTFKNCTSLASVTLPSTLIKIDAAGFYGCTALATLEIPDSVAILGKYCFKSCSGLTRMELPESLTEVRESAFYGCWKMRELVIPESVTRINPYAFKNCSGLRNIDLPEKLTVIADSAFYNCTGIRSIVIPAEVQTLGAYGFSRCALLASVTFLGDAPQIGSEAFGRVTATIYTSGWDDAVKQNYGGTLTWVEAE